MDRIFPWRHNLETVDQLLHVGDKPPPGGVQSVGDPSLRALEIDFGGVFRLEQERVASKLDNLGGKEYRGVADGQVVDMLEFQFRPEH